MPVPRYLQPSLYLDKGLRLLASAIRKYIATTPMIWGDDSNVQIGHNVHLVDVTINCRSGRVTIGDNVFFGHGVMILTGMHEIKKRGSERHAAVPASGRDVIIGNGAWIASGAIVIGPCTIGSDAVVGAGSVVSGTLEAGALYAGNPARLVRYIEFEVPEENQAGSL
jgi:acetyltransferase-like isoleucine patch superfamily enzyme